MQPPPYGLSLYGLCVPCEWVRNRDGDTVEVRLRTGQVVAVRLQDCWVAELNTKEGEKAKAFLDDLLSQWDSAIRLGVPLPHDTDNDGVVDVTELLKQVVSFDRVVGRLWLGSEDLSEYLVRHGYATRTKRAKG